MLISLLQDRVSSLNSNPQSTPSKKMAIKFERLNTYLRFKILNPYFRCFFSEFYPDLQRGSLGVTSFLNLHMPRMTFYGHFYQIIFFQKVRYFLD